jgi:hypothetical protein
VNKILVFLPAAILAFPVLLLGGADAEIKIVDNGKPKGVIVIPENGPELAPLLPWNKPLTVKYAADFLSSHIKEATGAELPVCTESKVPADSFIIALGSTSIARKNGVDPSKLPAEGYLIKSVPGGILIVGNVLPDGLDHGTLFGVYRFLEEFCGVRWYFAGRLGRIVPERKEIIIKPSISINAAPCFPVRLGGLGGSSTAEWHQILKFGMTRGLIANHTEESWKLLYGKTHPEYFGVDTKGVSCLKSSSRHFLCYNQPGVLEQCLENIRTYLKTGDITPWKACSGKPLGKNIPFGPNDTWQKCQCAECSKLCKPERNRAGRCSDVVFSFALKLAREMKKIDPELKLWCLAYQSYLLPPENPDLKLPDNLCITLCLYPTSTPLMINQKSFDENIELVNGWQQILGNDPARLIVWNYFSSPAGYLKAPTEHPHTLGKFINYLKGRSLGMFTDGIPSYQKTAYFQSFHMVWIMHRQLWDPSLDTDKLSEEYCRDLFGPVSGKMAEFYKLLDKSWEDVQWIRKGTYTVPTGTVFTENYPPQTIGALKNLLQQTRESAPENTIYRERLNWFADEVYGPFIARAEAYHLWRDKLPEERAVKVENAMLENGVPKEVVFTKSSPLPFLHFDGLEPWAPGMVKAAYDKSNLYFKAEIKLAAPRDAKSPHPVPKAGDFSIQFKSGSNATEFAEIIFSENGAVGIQNLPGNNSLQPSDIKSSSKIENGIWNLRCAIPWKAVSKNGTVLEMMRIQFLHNFPKSAGYDGWSPTLQMETYPGTVRFGKLHFSETK